MTMGKAFDDVISENEKYYLSITEKIHQDQLLLLLGFFCYWCHKDST